MEQEKLQTSFKRKMRLLTFCMQSNQATRESERERERNGESVNKLLNTSGKDCGKGDENQFDIFSHPLTLPGEDEKWKISRM